LAHAEGSVRERRLLERNVVVLSIASIVLLAASIAARADLTALETQVFRAVNDLPDAFYNPIWPLMQYGTFITIPALAVVALLFRRRPLALALALAGVGVYLLALLVKQIVERGRPGELSVVVAAHLSKRWTIAALVLGTVVLMGRLYVGAHLPLDVIGGAALGAVAGSAVNLIVRPAR
jgi:membrane-associated phospholipid phosphatase